MTLKTRIDLPSPTKVGGGLLTAARPLPSGWERGITFNGSTCLAPQPWPYCIDEASPPASPGEKVPGSLSDPSAFEPTGIVQVVECTTLNRDRSMEMASEALAATADYQVGLELATGVTTGNPSLADGSTVAAADLVNALAAAETYAAQLLHGRLAYFHVSPGALAILVGSDMVWRDGRTWRSPVGHLVVTSAGYFGLGETIHVTGEVFASTSVPETRVDVDRSINQSVAYAEQLGLAAFDPCINIAVEVTS